MFALMLSVCLRDGASVINVRYRCRVDHPHGQRTGRGYTAGQHDVCAAFRLNTHSELLQCSPLKAYTLCDFEMASLSQIIPPPQLSMYVFIIYTCIYYTVCMYLLYMHIIYLSAFKFACKRIYYKGSINEMTL